MKRIMLIIFLISTGIGVQAKNRPLIATYFMENNFVDPIGENTVVDSTRSFVDSFRKVDPRGIQTVKNTGDIKPASGNVGIVPDGGKSFHGASFVRDAVKSVGPSVVRINCDREIDPMMAAFSPDKFRDGDVFKVAGSGLIVSGDGCVVTNEHVVNSAKRITVTLSNGRTFKAKVVECDELTDLAVIKADIDKDVKLTPAPLGDSSKLVAGDWLIALGCPTGLDFTVTLGIVSSPRRTANEIGAFNLKGTYIQTDAALNSGNSGGPLINEQGEVVGINSMTRLNSEAIGFAIPINRVKAAYELLKRGLKPQHAYFGMAVTTITPDDAKINNDDPNASRLPLVSGALITRIVENSPAANAQMRRHDVILSINDNPIRDASEAEEVLDNCPPGKRTKFRVLRGDAIESMEFTASPHSLLEVVKLKREQQKAKSGIMKSFLMRRRHLLA